MKLIIRELLLFRKSLNSNKKPQTGLYIKFYFYKECQEIIFELIDDLF